MRLSVLVVTACASSSTAVVPVGPARRPYWSEILRQTKQWATEMWEEVESWSRVKAQRAGLILLNLSKLEEDPVEAYIRACQRYNTLPNGPVLSACRFRWRIVKPQGSFTDADLMALIDTLCETQFARGLDLTRVDKLYAIRALEYVPNLTFLALQDMPLGAEGAEALARTQRTLRALKLARCNVGDRGARALASMPLERLDLTENQIGYRTLKKLRKESKAVLQIRGNARGRELTCALIQGIGATLTPIAGMFLVNEARRLGLDPTAVASLALYATAISLAFASTSALHASELFLRKGFFIDKIARLSVVGAVAASHAPFVAFVDLGLPKLYAVQLAGASLLVAFLSLRSRSYREPPCLRQTSKLETLGLLGLGATTLFARFGPLRIALGDVGSKLLVSSALLAGSAVLLAQHKIPSYLAALVAVALHFGTVLTALVWHFLPDRFA